MRPTRPSLADAVRITDGPRYPVGAQFDGGSAHRRAMDPRGGARPSLDHGARRSVLRECSREFRRIFGRGKLRPPIERAVHRWALKLVGKTDFLRYYSQMTHWS